MKNESRLGLGTKFGYSIGIFADTMGYSIFYSYFIVFLTTVVGVNPAVAGVISSIGILWDGITDPIVGYFADSKPHRRRKMIMWASIPYAISVVLTFVAVDFGDSGNAVYYTICCLAFWLFYTMVCVPFYSAVPELTPDYNERTKLSNFRATINTIANLITLASPMLLVGFFGKWTNSVSGGWTLTAALFAVIIIVTSFICSITLKKASQEKDNNEATTTSITEKQSLGKTIISLLKTFGNVLRLKEVLILFIAITICNIYRGFTSTGFTFYMAYGVGWDAKQIGLGYALLVASWIFFFPIVTIVCSKWDRKICLIGGAVITVICRFLIIPIATTTLGAYLGIFTSNFLTCSYLALIFALPYDLAELYEYKNNGKRADSTIQSVPLMAQKIGAAIGALIWGFVLEKIKFNGAAAVQDANVISDMVKHYMGWINIALIAYVICLFLYKMNRQRVDLIQKANQARKEGHEYSSKGFEDVL